VLFVATVTLAVSRSEAEPPIALHPDNPHYFLWRGQPTVLVTSGEHYGALMNLDFDIVRYFDTLARDGLNHTRTFSGVYRETSASFNITDNTLSPGPGRYVCPWKRADQSGGFDGHGRFDLTQWDPTYFARLQTFMEEARQRGIVVEMNLFCPFYRDEMWEVCPMHARNNVNGIGNCPRDEVYALKHADLTNVQLSVTRQLVAALRDFDNVYFEVCNEPYARKLSWDWQKRMIEEIVAAEADIPQRHLISLNIANGSEKVADPHTHVSILNFHYCVPPDTVGMNFDLGRVIGENETGFRGRDDVLYRTEAWDFLLAGGGLYNNLDYSFTAAHPDGTFLDYRSPGGGSPELRRQLGILKRFLDRFEFVRMAPRPDVIRRVHPELPVQALVEEGQQYAICLHVPLPRKPEKLSDHLLAGISATIDIRLPNGPYQVEWHDTTTGEVVAQESLSHRGETATLTSPTFDNDIAVRIVSSRPARRDTDVSR
jgi:hypothetical protein